MTLPIPALRTGAALALIVGFLTTPTQAGELSDAEIIGVYSQVNSFDIETALIGQTLGASDAVRELGQMVSRDHSGVRSGVHALAADIGVIPVLPPARIEAAREHDAVVMSLRALNGAEFDAAYLRHEVAFHRAAIAAVETLLMPGAENDALRDHFADVLPAFRHHLQMTIEAANALGVSIDE